MENSKKYYKVCRKLSNGKFTSAVQRVQSVEYNIAEWVGGNNYLFIFDTYENAKLFIDDKFTFNKDKVILECECAEVKLPEEVEMFYNVPNGLPQGTLFAKCVKPIREVTNNEQIESFEYYVVSYVGDIFTRKVDENSNVTFAEDDNHYVKYKYCKRDNTIKNDAGSFLYTLERWNSVGGYYTFVTKCKALAESVSHCTKCGLTFNTGE